jgi:hypothetical protein
MELEIASFQVLLAGEKPAALPQSLPIGTENKLDRDGQSIASRRPRLQSRGFTLLH